MINLLWEPLPEAVEVDGTMLPIVTDFRQWLRFADLMEDMSVEEQLKVRIMMEWYHTPPDAATDAYVTALLHFYAGNVEKSPVQRQENPAVPVFDWRIDAGAVLGDFRRYYGIDLLMARMHWWVFRSLFFALPPDSASGNLMQIRSTDLSKIPDKTQRAEMARKKRAVALPFTYSGEMVGDALEGLFTGAR